MPMVISNRIDLTRVRIFKTVKITMYLKYICIYYYSYSYNKEKPTALDHVLAFLSSLRTACPKCHYHKAHSDRKQVLSYTKVRATKSLWMFYHLIKNKNKVLLKPIEFWIFETHLWSDLFYRAKQYQCLLLNFYRYLYWS